MAYNDILKLRIHCRMFGGEVLNVMHFLDNLVKTTDTAQELANDFRDNMGTVLRARATSELEFEFIEVVRIVPFGEGPRLAYFTAGSKGTATGTSYTGTICEVITIHTNTIGRRHRGRQYMCAGPGTAMATGNWAAAQTTRTQAYATALMNRYGPSATPQDFRLGVWSKLIAGPDPPWTTDAFTRATSLTVRSTIRNQRRRQLGVGR